MLKKWTVCHVGEGYSVKSKFKLAVTLEEARAFGKSEVDEKPYLKFVGILGVDLTEAKLNKIRNEPDELAKHLEIMNAG